MTDSDSTRTKTCTKCGECKPATRDFFFKSRDGLKASCKTCSSTQSKIRNEKNKKPSKFDYTGQRFGRLTALEKCRPEGGKLMWKYLCDCGKTVEKNAAFVNYGSISSCGCYRSDRISERKSAHIEGHRFGRIVAIARIGPDPHGRIKWACHCDCGKSCEITAVALRKGTKSCGCLQREAVSARQKAKALPPDVKRASVLASRAKQREKRKSNPVALMHSRLSRLHRHALTRLGALKNSSTLLAFGYSGIQFAEHIERQFFGGMGWENMSEWQIDHIIPISTAKTAEDVLALNQLSNLRPMWANQNNTKKANIYHLL